MDLKIKKLHPDAIIPKYAKCGDAGMDLYSIEDCNLEPGVVCSIKTGIATEFPLGYVALIWDKSGLATRHHLKTVAGVVDSGYRVEYLVSMINLGKNDYKIEKGDKIAQLIIQKIESPVIKIVKELSDSERGDNGFGSTGKK
jgi:dUTP pyrophosphatase